MFGGCMVSRGIPLVGLFALALFVLQNMKAVSVRFLLWSYDTTLLGSFSGRLRLEPVLPKSSRWMRDCGGLIRSIDWPGPSMLRPSVSDNWKLTIVKYRSSCLPWDR